MGIMGYIDKFDDRALDFVNGKVIKLYKCGFNCLAIFKFLTVGLIIVFAYDFFNFFKGNLEHHDMSQILMNGFFNIWGLINMTIIGILLVQIYRIFDEMEKDIKSGRESKPSILTHIGMTKRLRVSFIFYGVIFQIFLCLTLDTVNMIINAIENFGIVFLLYGVDCNHIPPTKKQDKKVGNMAFNPI